MTARSPTSLDRPTRLAALTGVLTFTMTMATFSQFVVGTLAPFLTEEFDMNRTQLGGLVTGAFLVAAVTSPTVGVIVDRTRTHRALTALFLLVAAMYAGASVAPSYLWLLVLLAIGGFAQALSNPITNKVIAQRVPTHSRGIIVGLKQSGVQFGALIAGLTLPTAASRFGWRAAVLGVAAVALIAAVVSVVGGRALSVDQTPSGEVRKERRRLTAEVRSLVAYAFLMGGGVASTTVHLPLFAHEELSFSPALAGLTIAIAGSVAIVARIAWGRASDRVDNLWGMLGLLGVGAIVGTVLTLTAMAWPVVVWPAVVFLGVSAMAWNALAMIAAVRAAGRDSTGWVAGVVNSGFFAGFVISPVVFGALVDATSQYSLGWLLLIGMYVGAWGIGLCQGKGTRRRVATTPWSN
jgi:predicted MFS family arabinose efflux permease